MSPSQDAPRRPKFLRRLVFVAIASLSSSTTDAFSIPTVADTVHMVQTLTHHAAPHVHAKAHVAAHHGVSNLLDAYKHQLAAHPLPTKMMTGATLAVAGDAIAQNQNKDEDYDAARATSFGVFDMCYRALQHYSFPVITEVCKGQFLGGMAATLLGHTAAVTANAAAMEQTLASQLIIVPFLYYPAFFALTGAMQGLDAQGSVQRAQENFIPLMKRNLLFWIPVQFVQFGFIPEDLQIPFLSCAGLAWTFILSVAAGSAKSYSSGAAAAEDATDKMMAVVSEISSDSVTSEEGIAVVETASAVNSEREFVKV